MFESTKFLSVNSHSQVMKLAIKEKELAKALSYFHSFLQTQRLPWPQILFTSANLNEVYLYITAPQEALLAIENLSEAQDKLAVIDNQLCSVTATCEGNVGSNLLELFSKKLSEINVKAEQIILTPLSISAILAVPQRESAIQTIHSLI